MAHPGTQIFNHGVKGPGLSSAKLTRTEPRTLKDDPKYLYLVVTSVRSRDSSELLTGT